MAITCQSFHRLRPCCPRTGRHFARRNPPGLSREWSRQAKGTGLSWPRPEGASGADVSASYVDSDASGAGACAGCRCRSQVQYPRVDLASRVRTARVTGGQRGAQVPVALLGESHSGRRREGELPDNISTGDRYLTTRGLQGPGPHLQGPVRVGRGHGAPGDGPG